MRKVYISLHPKKMKMKKILVFTLCLCFITLSTTVKSQEQMTKETMTELQKQAML